MYIIYFIVSGKGHTRAYHADWLTEAHEEHGDVGPSECVWIVPGTIGPRED